MNTMATTTERAQPGHVAGIAYLRRSGRDGVVPLILLHGIGSNAHSFEPLIAALPASTDVLAWHAPGYAASVALANASPTPDAYAKALSDLLDALDITRVTLVGHSLGCLFAARLAASQPDSVRALALLSPALGYQVSPGEALPPNVQSRIDEVRTLGPQAFADKRAARLVHQPERKPGVVAAVRAAMAAVHPEGYSQAVVALGAGDLLADAVRIKAPTLVAVGAQDAVTPPAQARAVHAALQRPMGYHEIAGTGHALPQEDPAAVARLLVSLMEGTDADL